MKYMGSKRSMLKNGLGEMLEVLVPKAENFFDLFTGSGAVAGHVAQRFNIKVYAGDLQYYAAVLAASQIEQTEGFDAKSVADKWIRAASQWLFEEIKGIGLPNALPEIYSTSELWRNAVYAGREYCNNLPSSFPLAKAYGGYYFSPMQAMVLDALRQSLPIEKNINVLAALIDAASDCAASPGHTAQPFGTKDTALPHLAKAWSKDVVQAATLALERIALNIAKIKGCALQTDALQLSEKLNEGDVAFIDPPYSEVQYSRFYHVLEAVAIGMVEDVKGVGRYPEIKCRPQSEFSRISQSAEAFNTLMIGVAASGAQAIVTFPSGDASNGLSGELVEEISSQYFHVRTRKISSIFSTMGGNSVNRDARSSATELVLHLVPK